MQSSPHPDTLASAIRASAPNADTPAEPRKGIFSSSDRSTFLLGGFCLVGGVVGLICTLVLLVIPQSEREGFSSVQCNITANSCPDARRPEDGFSKDCNSLTRFQCGAWALTTYSYFWEGRWKTANVARCFGVFDSDVRDPTESLQDCNAAIQPGGAIGGIGTLSSCVYEPVANTFYRCKPSSLEDSGGLTAGAIILTIVMCCFVCCGGGRVLLLLAVPFLLRWRARHPLPGQATETTELQKASTAV